MDSFYLDLYGYLGNPAIRVFIQRLVKLIDHILGFRR